MSNKPEIELKYKPLPHSYNCDEVKLLSSITGESFTFGFLKKTLDTPIAIIGIPEELNSQFLNIKFPDDENQYKYQEATLLEKDYPTYIVYPYNNSFEENKKLQHIHFIITKTRKLEILENGYKNQNDIPKTRKRTK